MMPDLAEVAVKTLLTLNDADARTRLAFLQGRDDELRADAVIGDAGADPDNFVTAFHKREDSDVGQMIDPRGGRRCGDEK